LRGLLALVVLSGGSRAQTLREQAAQTARLLGSAARS